MPNSYKFPKRICVFDKNKSNFMCSPNRYMIFQDAFFEYHHRTDREFPGRYSPPNRYFRNRSRWLLCLSQRRFSRPYRVVPLDLFFVDSSSENKNFSCLFEFAKRRTKSFFPYTKRRGGRTSFRVVLRETFRSFRDTKRITFRKTERVGKMNFSSSIVIP